MLMQKRHIGKTKTVVLAASLTAMLSVSAFTSAQSSSAERRGPPPEAYTACSSKAASATCSVSTAQGTKSGTCKSSVLETNRLVCVPSEFASRHNAALEASKKQ